MNENLSYVYILSKRRTIWDEFVIKCYRKSTVPPYLSRYSQGDYFTDDLDDAINTLKFIANFHGLKVYETKNKFYAEV